MTQILIAKQFIIPFESGVVVIKDWKIHNYIRKDTYNSTVYKFEKSQLLDDANGAYVLNESEPSTERPREVDTGKDRLGKDRLGKSNNNMSDKSDDVIPYSEIISYLNEKTGRSFRTTEAHKRFIKARWNENYKLDDFKRVVDNKVADWTGKTINGQPAEKYLQPSTLFGTKFDNYLNQTPMRQEQAQPYDDLGLPFQEEEMESIGDVIGKFVDMDKFRSMANDVTRHPEIEKFILDNNFLKLHRQSCYCLK